MQDPDTPKGDFDARGRGRALGSERVEERLMRAECREIRGCVAAVILLSALACGSGDSSRREAQALLERIAAIDLHASFERRAQQVQALATLPLATPALVEARDACSRAHGGLLEAERAQAAAKLRLDQLEASGQRDQAQLAAVAAQLASAARKLSAAQTAVPTCEVQARDLALHRP